MDLLGQSPIYIPGGGRLNFRLLQVEIVSGKWRSFAESWFGETFFQLGRIWLALLVYIAPGWLVGMGLDQVGQPFNLNKILLFKI